MNKLISDHFLYLQCMCEHFMATHDYSDIVVFSGGLTFGFMDDIPYPFKVNNYFKYFSPILHYPNTWVRWQRSTKPQLICYQPSTIWSAPVVTDLGDWAPFYEISIVKQLDDVRAILGATESRASIGEHPNFMLDWPLGDKNPPHLLTQINWYRSYKTEYEQDCVQQANSISVRGHRAAEQAFLDGATELETKMAFTHACALLDSELAYPSVVAYNQNASVLHYAEHSNQRYRKGALRSLLIDAGACFNGYAADITRSYAASEGSFAELIKGLDAVQKKIIADLPACYSYAEHSQRAQFMLAELLCDFDLITTAPETAIDLNLVPQFMPHGLGHFIGLQVHDPGGEYMNERGLEYELHAQFPTVKMGRPIEANQIVTVEPGIYFIDHLLGPLAQGHYRNSINWTLVEELRPYGGVRIEDNVLITADGVVNMTRTAFDQANQTLQKQSNLNEN